MSFIDPYALNFVDKRLIDRQESKRNKLIARNVVGLAPAIGVGGSLALIFSLAWLILPILAVLSLAGITGVYGHKLKNLRSDHKAAHLDGSYFLQSLASELKKIEPSRRENFRDLWDRARELDRGDANSREIDAFLSEARGQVEEAAWAYDELDAAMDEDPSMAAEVPEEFLPSNEARDALALASQHVEALKEITQTYTSAKSV